MSSMAATALSIPLPRRSQKPNKNICSANFSFREFGGRSIRRLTSLRGAPGLVMTIRLENISIVMFIPEIPKSWCTKALAVNSRMATRGYSATSSRLTFMLSVETFFMMKSIKPSKPTAYPYCPNCSSNVLRLFVPTYLRTMTFRLLIPSKSFRLLANKMAPRLVMLQLSSSPIQNPYSAIRYMILSTDFGISLSNNSKNFL